MRIKKLFKNSMNYRRIFKDLLIKKSNKFFKFFTLEIKFKCFKFESFPYFLSTSNVYSILNFFASFLEGVGIFSSSIEITFTINY